MFPRLSKKRIFLLIVTVTSISTCITFFLSPVTMPLIFSEMKTSLGEDIKTWQNMAYLVDTQALVANSVGWLEEPTPWEADLLTIQLSNDPLKESNGSLSTMVLLNNSLDIRLGNLLVLMINVSNGYGQVQQRGGDDIRVWVTDDTSQSSLIAYVSDLRNGSYLASFRALFPGIVKIKAAISYSKEYLSKIVTSIRQGYVQFDAGLFQKDGQSEVTLCGPFSALPNYTAVCDFSAENNNISWFCGLPINHFLSCQDWTSVRSLPTPKASALPARRPDTHLNAIPNVLSVNITEGGPSLHLPPCTLRSHPLGQTWLELSPQGYMKMGSLYPRTCQLLDIGKGAMASCLTNKTVSLVGSSPFLNEVFKVFQKITGCENEPALGISCLHKSQEFKVKSHPFALPIFSEKNEWIPKSVIAFGVNKTLGPGQHIVLIDHSVHTTGVHYSVFREKVRWTAHAAENLLDHNDQVFIAVAGPQAIPYKSNLKNDKFNYACGDCFADQFINIMKEEYKRLRKGVLFLNGWDLSSVNSSFYSTSRFHHEMVKLLLNYACDFFEL